MAFEALTCAGTLAPVGGCFTGVTGAGVLELSGLDAGVFGGGPILGFEGGIDGGFRKCCPLGVPVSCLDGSDGAFVAELTFDCGFLFAGSMTGFDERGCSGLRVGAAFWPDLWEPEQLLFSLLLAGDKLGVFSLFRFNPSPKSMKAPRRI